MTTFEFSVIASGLDPDEADDFADRFFEAGCDDATISFQKGHIILDFAREAESIDEAICSAVESVARSGAHVDRIASLESASSTRRKRFVIPEVYNEKRVVAQHYGEPPNE